MTASLLEILRSVPDHRRREGQRFELATVLLYAILGMVAGANSYRQLHEFVRAHRGARSEGLPLHSGRRTLSKKGFARVIASGNHLLTQVKDNQPNLRRRLELGAMGRKPSGSATSKSKGCNRWETRELTVFPAKAWFRHTPWEKLINTVLRLERTVCKRDPKTGLCRQTSGVVFWVSSLNGPAPEKWNEWIRRHWRIENGSHYVRDVAFAEDASRIRKNPDIAARLRSFAYNLLRAASCDNIKNARWRAALDLDLILAMPGMN